MEPWTLTRGVVGYSVCLLKVPFRQCHLTSPLEEASALVGCSEPFTVVLPNVGLDEILEHHWQSRRDTLTNHMEPSSHYYQEYRVHGLPFSEAAGLHRKMN